VSFDVGVRKNLVASQTFSIQRLVDPPYSHRTTHLRDANISKSQEAKAISKKIISHVSPFDRREKTKKAIVNFSFVSEDWEKSFLKNLSWIPKVIQNERLLNIALLFVMHMMEAKSKGAKGWVGGHMSILLDALKRQHPSYSPLIQLNIELGDTRKSYSNLLKNHEPLMCVVGVAIAKYEGDDIVDIIHVAKGMILCSLIIKIGFAWIPAQPHYCKSHLYTFSPDTGMETQHFSGNLLHISSDKRSI